jgi:hypothetical protein
LVFGVMASMTSLRSDVQDAVSTII